MTSDDIRDAILCAGIGALDTVNVLDRDYSLPTARWIEGRFAHDYRSNLWTLGVETYRPESGDCDDFAFLAMAMAKLCHRKNSPAKTGLAFGFIGYTRDNSTGHAVNLAITGPGKVVFFEPQTGKLIQLSENEKAHSHLVII